MKAIKSYRLRKCSDVDMEYPYFEVIDNENTTIFDIAKSDEGEFRILFYEGASSKWMSVSMLEAIIEEVKKSLINRIWSNEIDSILSVGRSLPDIGIRNWALSRGEALVALAKLVEIEIAVLGGDVYSIIDGSLETNYDNWYCNRDELESDSAYLKRSVAVAKDYITNYKAPEGSVLFAIVPKV